MNEPEIERTEEIFKGILEFFGGGKIPRDIWGMLLCG